MDKTALEAARQEFDSAAASLSDMRASNDFPTVERHWTSFLYAANRIFTKLEQGSKSSDKSAIWWAGKVSEWRCDELLRYVRHARHAKDHTIQPIAKLQEGSAKTVEPTEQDKTALAKAMQGETRPWTPLALVEVTWSHCKLLPVVVRGNTFHPPKTHLDHAVLEDTPTTVGGLVLAYLEALIKEAEKLAP
jgi:hypothetical protein